ncbi:RNA polymerase sigma factor [Streptomyces mirabilis]|uniref:RNA polymerase sigma factor n=1 Tax=Streptomyces mirabilis TaxID=68239 RepID=UPI0036B460F0
MDRQDLCDVEGFSYQETADFTGVTTNTVGSRIYRARHHLRQLLQEYAGEHGLVQRHTTRRHGQAACLSPGGGRARVDPCTPLPPAAQGKSRTHGRNRPGPAG